MSLDTVEECKRLHDAAVAAEKTIALEDQAPEVIEAVRMFQHHLVVEMGNQGLIDPTAAREASWQHVGVCDEPGCDRPREPHGWDGRCTKHRTGELPPSSQGGSS